MSSTTAAPRKQTTPSRNAARGRITTPHRPTIELDSTVTPSSGNVFADLGFEDPDGEAEKARLVIILRSEMERRNWSQTKFGEAIGLSQPDVSHLMRGRVEGYSLHRMLSFLTALGMNVDITVTLGDPTSTGRRTLRFG